MMKVGTLSLLSDPRSCISNHSLAGRVWVLSLERMTSPAMGVRVARAPQEDEAQKTKGSNSMSWPWLDTPWAFKKYILFLKGWQQFLLRRELGSFRDLPFPVVSLLCFDWLIDWGGEYRVRSCRMSRLLFGEASWWGTYFGATLPFGHHKLNYIGFCAGRMVPREGVPFGGRKLGFSLALPFTTVIWGVTHLRSPTPSCPHLWSGDSHSWP